MFEAGLISFQLNEIFDNFLKQSKSECSVDFWYYLNDSFNKYYAVWKLYAHDYLVGLDHFPYMEFLDDISVNSDSFFEFFTDYEYENYISVFHCGNKLEMNINEICGSYKIQPLIKLARAFLYLRITRKWNW